jgi:hypothetical protein
MGRFNLIAVRVVSVSLLTFAFLGMGSFGNANAADASSGDELQPPSAPPAAKRPLGTFAAPVPGETLAWFFPTDNDATGTVIYLLNTDSVAHTVQLRGYNFDGAMVYAQNIDLPAISMRRLVSDSVAAAPPPSWAGPPGNTSGVAPITTNFTDFVYFASFSLAKGVKVDGYVVFNPGTGTIDPRADQGAIPLRFLTSPFYLPQ